MERIEGIDIRPMRLGDEVAIGSLVARVFREFVTSNTDSGGLAEFLAYARPDAVRYRYREGSMLWVAVRAEEVIGVAEVRKLSHVSLLFVDGSWQGRGIARRLWDTAYEACVAVDPSIEAFTVNSSEFAVPVYRRFGFVESGRPEVVEGIVSVPMVLRRQANAWDARRVG